MRKTVKRLSELLLSPKAAYRFSLAVFKGTLYIIWYSLTTKNVKIKFPFLCYAKFEIIGSGKVFIDRGCSVWPNTFEHLVIYTLSPEAEVRIGKNCTIGGLTIRCFSRINIGDRVLFAANLVQDVPITSANFFTYNNVTIHPVTISVGNDTWLGGQAIVLADSKVGDGGVLGMNALLFKSNVGEQCIANGNPAMRPIPISKLDILKSIRKM